MVQVYPKYSYFENHTGHFVCSQNANGFKDYVKHDSKESCLDSIRSLEAIQINALIQKRYGINLVTCGNCGCIQSHGITKKDRKRSTLKCDSCNEKMAFCDCPDLFY